MLDQAPGQSVPDIVGRAVSTGWGDQVGVPYVKDCTSRQRYTLPQPRKIHFSGSCL